MTRGPLKNQSDFSLCVRCNEFTPVVGFIFDDGTSYCLRCFDYLRGGDVDVVQENRSEVRESGEVQEDVS